jgi:GAF domain-containing protein
VNSGDPVADDLLAITAFAHQMAAAWHRAQLFEQAQQELVRRRQAEETSVRLTTVIEQDTNRYLKPCAPSLTNAGC